MSLFSSPTEVELDWALDCQAKASEPTGFNISYCIAEGDTDECIKNSGGGPENIGIWKCSKIICIQYPSYFNKS